MIRCSGGIFNKWESAWCWDKLYWFTNLIQKKFGRGDKINFWNNILNMRLYSEVIVLAIVSNDKWIISGEWQMNWGE
jgi:hypothetical protein